MRLCLLTVPGRSDNPRLGLAGPDSVVLDANELHATALAGHMEGKRAYELADALVPSDLYGFIRNGRHSWRALDLALEFLGSAAFDTALESPRGQRVVFHSSEVELRPLLHRDTGSAALDAADQRIVRAPLAYGVRDDRVSRMSHSLGGVTDVEYVAIIGKATDTVDDISAWEYVAGYAKLTAGNDWQALYLYSVDELDAAGDTDVYCELADAISLVSRDHNLEVGDIVRTGTRGAASLLDLTGGPEVDLATGEPSEPGAPDVLERLLTRVDR